MVVPTSREGHSPLHNPFRIQLDQGKVLSAFGFKRSSTDVDIHRIVDCNVKIARRVHDNIFDGFIATTVECGEEGGTTRADNADLTAVAYVAASPTVKVVRQDIHTNAIARREACGAFALTGLTGLAAGASRTTTSTVVAVGSDIHTDPVAVGLSGRTHHLAGSGDTDESCLTLVTALTAMVGVKLNVDTSTRAVGGSRRTNQGTCAVGADFARLAGRTARSTVRPVGFGVDALAGADGLARGTRQSTRTAATHLT